MLDLSKILFGTLKAKYYEFYPSVFNGACRYSRLQNCVDHCAALLSFKKD